MFLEFLSRIQWLDVVNYSVRWHEARGATKTERLIRSKPVNEELDTTLLLNHRGKHIEVPFSATIKPSPPRHRSPIDSVSITRPITWTLFSVLAGKRKGEVFPLVSKYTRYYRTRTITKTQMHFHHPGFKWLRQWCTIKTSNDRANILSLSLPFSLSLYSPVTSGWLLISENSLRRIKESSFVEKLMRLIENEWKHTRDKKDISVI